MKKGLQRSPFFGRVFSSNAAADKFYQRADCREQSEQGEKRHDLARHLTLEIEREPRALRVLLILQGKRNVKTAGQSGANFFAKTLCLDLCQSDFSIHKSLPHVGADACKFFYSYYTPLFPLFQYKSEKGLFFSPVFMYNEDKRYNIRRRKHNGK